MLVAIHQPNLFPRLKVLQKICHADLWIVLDDVKFNPRDYQHRAYLAPTLKGQPERWLTIPMSVPKDPEMRKIYMLQLQGASAVPHLQSGLSAAFGRRDVFNDIVNKWLVRDDRNLLTWLSIDATRAQLDWAGAKTPNIVLASSLRSIVEPKSLGILQLLEIVQATAYLADSGATAYLDDSTIEAAGIDIAWQVWTAPRDHFGLGSKVLRDGAALNLSLRDPVAGSAAILCMNAIYGSKGKRICAS